MTRRLALVLAAALVAASVFAPDALAHGIVGREDLPIPRWLFGWAATAVLVLSFVALAVLLVLFLAASALALPLLITVSVAFAALVAARYVLPAADRVEGRETALVVEQR